MILTVIQNFLSFKIGDRITDPALAASIFANSDYSRFVVDTATGTIDTTPPTLPLTVGLLATTGVVYPDNESITINDQNVLEVITANGLASGSDIGNYMVTVNNATQTLAQWLGDIFAPDGLITNSSDGLIVMANGQPLGN